ncbi:M48 family metallopeptidase [Rheinheimera maricola]|uniref:M48 family metallopeptidase n=1 Tax=Rheinheimera maricola TaxID=2793282 RepID=A0ABS7XC50_9GAMM|nr:M48 family metallopeptidase [Rheinheimera maricola]MBZ9612197.1 M48 family metallopeptidase [Rheinheimera maricola]
MQSTNAISGQFQHSGSSTLYAASATLDAGGYLSVRCQQTNDMLAQAGTEDYRFGVVIPGLPVELRLRDGAVFVPDDNAFRWPQLSGRANLAARLESHKLSIVAAIVLSPLLLWWIIVDLMPMLASAAVPLVPDKVKQQMGEQTFYSLQQTVLSPTELPQPEQAMVRYHWQMALQQLHLQQQHYQLHLFKSEFFGANAFALPDGTVVITDDLVLLLKHNPDAILAVLLHEIGHVEGQHSVRLVAQSLGATLVIGIMFGNPEGVADLLLGSGSVLLQNAFSRDMEREADQFAIAQLTVLGKTPSAFADAMSALLAQHSEESAESSTLLKYLSTHPDTRERIQQATQPSQ